jgi:hypothetical protein
MLIRKMPGGSVLTSGRDAYLFPRPVGRAGRQVGLVGASAGWQCATYGLCSALVSFLVRSRLDHFYRTRRGISAL